MMSTLQKHWRLFWLFRKFSLMRLTAYRANFFFWMIITTIWGIFNFVNASLFVGATGSVGGWDQAEVFTLVGVFTILDGVMWSFMYHNMQRYTQSVFDGSLSTLLIKPVNTLFVICTQTNSYTNIIRIFLGLGILIWAIPQLSRPLTLINFGLFLLFFIIALFFLYSIWFLIATISFWVEKLDSIEDIIDPILLLWRFPRTIYRGIVSTIFTVVLPLGLLSSIPAEFLIGRASWNWALYFAGFTAVLLLLARTFFYYSIRRYSSVGG